MTKKISDKIDPHELPSRELLALWALDQLEQSGDDRFAVATITNFLVEVHGINTSAQAIRYGLGVAKKATNKNTLGGYKLMEAGRKRLRELLPQEEGVIIIEPGKPFSSKNVVLKKILGNLDSIICISDPYLDLQTLDLLYNSIDKSKSIRFLTAKILDKPRGAFLRQLADLRYEGFQIEIGLYTSSSLHDRYFFDDRVFWHSGNSLNGLGKKESFLILLDEDVRQSMESTFNRRWKEAKKV